MTPETWNMLLSGLVIIGAIGSVLLEHWSTPTSGKFDWRYMYFVAAPSVFGVIQGTVATPVFEADKAILGQIIGALSVGAGLTRATTLAARKMGLHPRKQEDIITKQIDKQTKEGEK